MKVLYLLNSSVMGGATISFLNMVKGLCQKGVMPVVIIPGPKANNEFVQILEENKIPYYLSTVASSTIEQINRSNFIHCIKSILLLPYRKWISRRKLLIIVKKEKPDIIHTNVGVIHEGYHVAKKLNIPHVWHLREYQTKDFYWYIYPSYNIFRSYLNKSRVITITNGIKDYFKLSYPCAQTIYNGIYHLNEVCYVKNKCPYFLVASRISPEKGISDVIKAFARFSIKNEYRLKIAGMGNEKYIKSLVDMARELGCLDRIDFLGFQKDVRPLMSSAKALIVGSFYEGFGRMTAEAAFCGTLTIGRNTAGTKEIMDVIGGLSFDSVDKLTMQMKAMVSMPTNEYEQKVLYAQKKALENYSIESNVDKIYALYEKIILEITNKN